MKAEDLHKSLIDLSNELLNEDLKLKFKMTGNSMFPVFRHGDTGIVSRCSPEELQIGDILVFKMDGKLVAHRLVKKVYIDQKLMLCTRGDKNYKQDPTFPLENLIGRITSFERKGKTKPADSFLFRMIRLAYLYLYRIIVPFSNMLLRLNLLITKVGKGSHSIFKNLGFVTRSSSRILFINVLIAIFQGVLPFVIIVCLKWLIDDLSKILGQQMPRTHFDYVMSFTAFVFVFNAINAILRNFYYEKLSQSVSLHIYEVLHRKHSSLEMSHYEDSDQQDKIHRAVQEAGYRPMKIISEVLTLVKSLFSGLVILALFIQVKWYLLFVLMAAIAPGTIIKLKFSKKLYQLKKENSTKEREQFYFNKVLTNAAYAKELKLFGFRDFFLHKFKLTQHYLFGQKIALSKTEIWSDIAGQLFAVVIVFLSIGYVSYLALNGKVSVGTVVMFFFIFQRGYSILTDFFRSITKIAEDNIFLNDFIDFLHLPEEGSQIQNQLELPALNEGIFIQNVSFQYRTSQRKALNSINLTIPKGKTVAFVGANGSGKTTLIKLLCGFYRPSSGRILFDDIDLAQVRPEDICKQITSVFQDFALYNMTALENIALGDIEKGLDIERAKSAAKDADVHHVLENLPKGYDNLLGNLFKGGEELSIGQWQKIAIARAFYRNSSILFMDEPSSALDAETELHSLQKMRELSRDKTVVIISHRMSTIQWADVIYVFNQGEVIESGNHQELMELKGKYYSLFETSKSSIE